MTPQSVERPISMTDDELIRLLNEIVRREEQLGKPIAMPKPRLETIELAATRIEQLRKALEAQDGLLMEARDFIRTNKIVTGSIGESIARRIDALIQSGER